MNPSDADVDRPGGAGRAATAESAGEAAPLAGDDTRQRILRAATALFYERGYHATSVNEIAKAVGVSGPALYWHFESKREICFTAVYEELRRFAYALEPAVEESTPEAQLGQFVRSYVILKLKQNEWLETPGAVNGYQQLHDALTSEQRLQLDALQRHVLEMLKGILSAGDASGVFRFTDLTATAFAIVTMCEYVFAWVSPGGRLGTAAIADLYRELALSMVGAGLPDREVGAT